ncbi:glycoside hydrolase family 2 TIM barrel-domain containing protein [Winogradskyella sediminis]|uniref:glycoside hydrolase family 2 TIM barrel-domain containing protein n=1 Tax=Winogradskyella sediminis TaxID=1382466 RepID=UPI001B868BED|nr:glycoside hydrolase family 2 TIM barrel-domain containing protein [Winogradskyella sediminis]
MICKIHPLFLMLCVAYSYLGFSQTKIINSGWQFSEDKTNWQTVNIPHTWNQDDAFDDDSGYRRGLGYYQKHIFFSSETSANNHYLKFNAVNQDATVYVNGKEIGNHKGGYTAFNFNISEYINYDTYNVIEVTVDNSHNEDIPPLDADFTFYGGIYRDVELISLPKQHFSLEDFASEGFYVNYPHVSKEKASIEITTLLKNTALNKVKTALELVLTDADGNVVKTHIETLQLKPQSIDEFKLLLPEIKHPKLWSPDDPYLYKLQLILKNKTGAIVDTKTTNIGFRWVSVDAKKGFYLNGEPIKLIGVNRHQDYEGYGNAVPMALQKKDIELIKDMGSNVIRFAHYPHARELYKMCDELGILVWTEIPVVNKVTNSEAFFETSIKMQKEHLKQYYNYPSVVMFGYMNEIFLRLAFDKKESDAEKEERKKYTYQLAKQLEDLTRKEAPNHITVMALHFNELYNETKIADLSMLVGWNLYFGWYHDTIEDLGVFLDNQHQRYPDRAIMISEYGPGADVRVSATQPSRYDYSQQYQLLLHSGYYNQVEARDYVTGMTAWNFADFGSEFRGETIPHVNQKGLVQYNREPKEVYYWYQSVLKEKEPHIHIANYEDTITLLNSNQYDVTLFSNQKKAKLYVNDIYLQNVTFKDGMAIVTVPFVNGINTLKAETEMHSDVLQIKANVIKTLKENPNQKLAINIGTHINYSDDVNGVTFLQDRVYTKGLYGYVPSSGKCEKKLVPFNISNSNQEAIFQTMLVDCETYKVDIPNGSYKITLYFVEPDLKNKANIVFNLSNSDETSNTNISHRVFDISLNDKTVVSQFNMAKAYSAKYGITQTFEVDINNNVGLTIGLNAIKGDTVISGILIEKID